MRCFVTAQRPAAASNPAQWERAMAQAENALRCAQTSTFIPTIWHNARELQDRYSST
jgi:hypothetical protein